MDWNLSSDIWKAISTFIADWRSNTERILSPGTYTCAMARLSFLKTISHAGSVKKRKEQLIQSLLFTTVYASTLLLTSCSSALLASSSDWRANFTNFFWKNHQPFLAPLPFLSMLWEEPWKQFRLSKGGVPAIMICIRKLRILCRGIHVLQRKK